MNFLGEVNTVSDLPSYVKYWRNKFTQEMNELGQRPEEQPEMLKILAEYTTCLQMNAEESASLPNSTVGTEANSNSKQNFYFLSDILPEDKVYRQLSILIFLVFIHLLSLSIFTLFVFGTGTSNSITNEETPTCSGPTGTGTK